MITGKSAWHNLTDLAVTETHNQQTTWLNISRPLSAQNAFAVVDAIEISWSRPHPLGNMAAGGFTLKVIGTKGASAEWMRQGTRIQVSAFLANQRRVIATGWIRAFTVSARNEQTVSYEIDCDDIFAKTSTVTMPDTSRLGGGLGVYERCSRINAWWGQELVKAAPGYTHMLKGYEAEKGYQCAQPSAGSSLLNIIEHTCPPLSRTYPGNNGETILISDGPGMGVFWGSNDMPISAEKDPRLGETTLKDSQVEQVDTEYNCTSAVRLIKINCYKTIDSGFKWERDERTWQDYSQETNSYAGEISQETDVIDMYPALAATGGLFTFYNAAIEKILAEAAKVRPMPTKPAKLVDLSESQLADWLDINRRSGLLVRLNLAGQDQLMVPVASTITIKAGKAKVEVAFASAGQAGIGIARISDTAPKNSAKTPGTLASAGAQLTFEDTKTINNLRIPYYV
ncbi:hypothetical protein HMPREF9306_01441 [Propionimicrobium lymphophilum ACS-093-V-SCH5]|uniref:Uncharacterized protein n=1 Tax=Propionimicrobium lymphophilum ACS-093-V-SCH5 TaxID=883161 RepID=S2W0J4_9ACTN|nr:hypothetical protein [Propionimicrobium lymphophilum]EPD31885.1 hypothetical protein HMPREF9306_01441 [Propionimicrobium lymphophilum ACS-093-V-SCH5]